MNFMLAFCQNFKVNKLGLSLGLKRDLLSPTKAHNIHCVPLFSVSSGNISSAGFLVTLKVITLFGAMVYQTLFPLVTKAPPVVGLIPTIVMPTPFPTLLQQVSK